MNVPNALRFNHAFASLLAATGLFAAQASTRAQSVQHLSVPQPGGMPGRPVVTGIQQTTNSVTVTWDGPSGYYQLFQAKGLKGVWQGVGPRTNLSRKASVPLTSTNTFFKVSGPSAEYAGAQVCIECHGPVHTNFQYTAHAQAFQVLQAANQDRNSSCLACHTLGYGLPTGFVSQTATPQLPGVQCENCHGAAGNHAANPDDITVRPRVEIAATLCGGCHTGSQSSTYKQWSSSLHAQVVEDLNPSSLTDSCGRCHSGSVRLSLLNHQALPSGDANVPIVCGTCHNPHQTNAVAPFQLRNPLASTNDYFITTSAPFTNQYNPNINLCGQCHNHRGASWASSSRAPHHSPQYNMFLGTVGELASGPSTYQPGPHAMLLTNQCVECHMQDSALPPDQYHPNLASHTSTVDSHDRCLECHPNPSGIIGIARNAVTNEVNQINSLLNVWALTKAPLALQQKYGTRAWEYTNPGDLSPGGPGPDATEQPQIPVNIQKARFNLYLVVYDGSFGAHNPYAFTLLDTALTWVQQELSQ
ncbi:MAG TPA: cytochrome c family protein [Candidatus Acidoferrum sp.]|jgi:hypothetical protein|nr:cytochrome c family protein [Candidatus Acidoferrum sp.]